MDDKQNREDKKLAEEIISDKELDSVTGVSNPSKKDEPDLFMRDFDGKLFDHGRTGPG